MGDYAYIICNDCEAIPEDERFEFDDTSACLGKYGEENLLLILDNWDSFEAVLRVGEKMNYHYSLSINIDGQQDWVISFIDRHYGKGHEVTIKEGESKTVYPRRQIAEPT